MRSFSAYIVLSLVLLTGFACQQGHDREQKSFYEEMKDDHLVVSKQGIEFFIALHDSVQAVSIAQNVAENYKDKNQLDSAIYYYQYALAFAKDADEKVISDRLADLCHERALQKEQASRQWLLGILLKIGTAVLALGVFAFLFLRLKGRRGEAKIKRCPVEERKQGCLVQESLPEITEDRVVVSSMGKNEQAKLFLNSEICLRFRDKNPWRPAANDWAELYRNLDLAYDNFTVRLRNLIPITDKELQTACLIKAGVMPGVIGQLLCCSPASVSMTRKRLYEKIYQKPGSAELFDQFISQF